MPRASRNKEHQQAFGTRLTVLVDVHLNTTRVEVASALGYSDSSTITAACAGRAGLDLERLVRLAHWSADRGKPLNLHWLLTGEGRPLLRGRLINGDLWLTPARKAAIQTLALGLSTTERDTPRSRRLRT